LNIDKVDGILLDLGVSSYQLEEVKRGFSYMKDAPMDMRMDKNSPFSAYDVVNKYSQQELERVIREYGEEKWASRIAKFIVKEREKGEIKTTFQLVEIIKNAVPASARREGPHPAKRTFQAIRIEVNEELIKNTKSKFFNFAFFLVFLICSFFSEVYGGYSRGITGERAHCDNHISLFGR